MTFEQANTILQVTTPLGADQVLLVRFRAEERLSALFRFDLDLVSPKDSLAFNQILGQGVTVKIKLAGGKFRHFNGIVTRFAQAGRAGKLTNYSAEVHPKLWLLSRMTDCRIYQNKTVPEIIKSVLSDHGIDPIEDKLKSSYSAREYCVQYQETDLDFIARLMEEEGIFYYFQHGDGQHKLVLGDDSSAHVACPEHSRAKYRGEVATSLADEDIVTACEVEEQVTVGSYAVTDYNFEMPTTSLLGEAAGSSAALEVFEYPGNHQSKSSGESRAKLRLEAEEAFGRRLFGTSYVRTMSAGHAFALTEHDRSDANTDWVVAAVTHAATGEEYSNRFEAFPKAVPFRPPRYTRKPVIHGTQTATVTGKSGEEIWTDKYGRIKVLFHWDRHNKKDETSSCWIRVAQGWAGKGWGAWFLPRLGQEVVVSFLGGDPDRPLVIGSVYNAQQTVPYGLPGAQTKSTILSRSSKDGEHGNELRFEDKKDDEEVFLHAEKDMNFSVENDYTTDVERDKIMTVKRDRSATVEEGDESLVVKKGNRTVEVKEGDESHSVKGNRELKVDGEETHQTKGAFTHKSKDAYTLKVDGDLTIDVKGSVTFKSAQSITIKAGTEMTVEATTSLTNKAGTELTNQAKVKMTNDGGVSLTNKASATQTVDGGGMLELKGGMVKIN